MKLPKNKTAKRKLDLFLMILFPILAAILVLILKTKFVLVSILLFFGLPSLYLSCRRPDLIRKSLLFAALLSLVPSLMIDYLATLSGTWFTTETIFSFRLLDVVMLEMLPWGFLYVFFMIMFYEHFLDFGKGQDRPSKKTKYLFIWLILLITIFVLFRNQLVAIDYLYLKGGVVLLALPVITFLSFFSKPWKKFIRAGVYFFALSFLYELVAIKTGQWIFPGQKFIGSIRLLGLSFPFEEFLFWFVIGSSAMLSYYEFFVDDRK